MNPVKIPSFFILFLFLLVFLSASSSFAGVKDASKSDYESLIINKDLTPERVLALGKKITASGGKDQASLNQMEQFSKSTVFWMGRIEKTLERGEDFLILVKCDSGRYFWAFAKKTMRNLDFDRKGYKIGIKGSIILKDGNFDFLRAKSVVLIAAPPEISYPDFVKSRNLSFNFDVHTPQGVVNVGHRYYPFILHRVYIYNPHYPLEEIKKIGSGIVYYSWINSVDPLLLAALINVESAFDVDAVSKSGAIGLGQLMPSTSRGIGINPEDLSQNISGAAKYLHEQLERWKGCPDQVQRALASYNAGPGAVARSGGVPKYSETQNYVYLINLLYEEYRKQYNEYVSEQSEN